MSIEVVEAVKTENQKEVVPANNQEQPPKNEVLPPRNEVLSPKTQDQPNTVTENEKMSEKKEEPNLAEKTIAESNREVMKPFVNSLTNRLLEEIDKAADKGIVLQKGLSSKQAEKILETVLSQIQQEYIGSIYEDRNILQSAAYFAGTALGYPRQAIRTVLRKLPLSDHFCAGLSNGGRVCDDHITRSISCLSAKKDRLSKMLSGKESKDNQTSTQVCM